MEAINAYFCSSTRALIICCKSQRICSTAAGQKGRFKSPRSRSTFELLIFIALKCDNATEASSHTECPVTLVLNGFLGFFWLLVLIKGAWWKSEGEEKTVPSGGSYSSQETTAAPLSSCRTRQCVPSHRRLAGGKKTKHEIS